MYSCAGVKGASDGEAGLGGDDAVVGPHDAGEVLRRGWRLLGSSASSSGAIACSR
jgi:hypothetical protein